MHKNPDLTLINSVHVH